MAEDLLKPRALVVGVSGATCSGKSTLLEGLKNALTTALSQRSGHLNVGKVAAVCMDDYYVQSDAIPVARVCLTCRSRLRMNDHLSFCNCREIMRETESMTFPDWDSPDAINAAELCRKIDSLISECAVVLVDGFLLPAFSEIAERLDFVVHLTIEEKLCRDRRLERDDWVRANDAYFDACVWPSFLEFGTWSGDPRIDRHPALVLAADQSRQELIDAVMLRIPLR